MTGQWKFALVSAVAGVCVLGTTMQSQALNCQRGSFTTSRCYRALEQQIGQAQGIVDCLKAMEDEYSGRNGAAGAGRNFAAKKQQCLRLIASLNRGAGLDEASAGQADVDSAVQAIRGWAR
jgi:hypothetical protein